MPIDEIKTKGSLENTNVIFFGWLLSILHMSC